MIKRAIAAWVLLAVLMVINGVVREIGYAPEIGAYAGNVISTLTGIVLVFSVAYFFVKSEKLTKWSSAWEVGGLWLVLTLLFEAGLGFAGGGSMADVLAAYNITEGEVWPVLLASVAIAPAFWTYHFRAEAARPDPRIHFPLVRL